MTYRMSGKSLDEDLKTAGFAIDYIGDVSRSYLRMMVRKQCVLVMIHHLARQNKPTTFDRNVKKILNEAGYFHLSLAARKMGISKQYLWRMTSSLPETGIIEVGGRAFYYAYTDKKENQ